MPTTYAHYKFGNEVAAMLPQSYRDAILEEKELFDFGLHGPDLLFYYRIWKQNPVTTRGHRIHRAPAVSFMKRAATCYRGQVTDPEFRTQSLAFLYGFLCHFALDRACHGYINEMARQKLASHSRIEAEFDRYLLLEDGYDPLEKDLASHLHPSVKNARLIREYFGFTEEMIYESMQSMVVIIHALQGKNPVERKVLTTALDKLHKQSKLEMIMPLEESETVRAMSQLLAQMFEEAKKDAVEMITEFETLVETGAWDEKYFYNFGGKHMKKIDLMI